jgi:hypothetical protein
LILSLAVVFGMAAQTCAGQTTIASKRSHDLYISLLSQSGKLVEKDEYCVLFSKTNGGEPAQVEDVFVDFSKQVGKITGVPRKVSLSLDNLGRYCGTVDLGNHYNQPAVYYVVVRYTDTLSKRRKCRFLLTVK